MQSNFAAHFFQSLSFALLNSIWQMALCWFFFLIVNNKKENNPHLKYIFLVVIQIIGFGWFLQTFSSAYNHSQNVNALFNISYSQISLVNQLLFFTGILYLLFVGYHIILFFIGIQSIEKIKHNNIETSIIDFGLFVEQMSKSLDIASQVCLKVSSKINTPLTIGVLKPIILIPFAAINSLSPIQMEAIILHELAHIKRKDYLINLLLLTIDIFMFFNPFSRIIKKQIFFERELCCDDIVLKYQFQKSVYVEALVNIASLQVSKPNSVFTLNAVSSKHELLNRVQRIFGLKNTYESKANKMVTLAIALFIGLLTLNISPINKTENLITKNPINTKDFVIQDNLKVEKKIAKHIASRSIKPTSSFIKQITVKEIDKKTDLKNDLVETLNYFKPKENYLSHFTYQNNNEEIGLNYATIQEPIVATTILNKYPIITSQKFFIPATTYKPSSLIIVTTTESVAGKKTVQIEILKGNGKVE